MTDLLLELLPLSRLCGQLLFNGSVLGLLTQLDTAIQIRIN
jgi:hypothetical protein